MKRMCDVMRNGSFRRYPELINRFIEESQKQAFGKKDIFVEIEHLCVNTAEIITRVCSADIILKGTAHNKYSTDYI